MLTRLLLAPVLFASLAAAQGNWRLIWSDEFDGTAIDTTKWGYDIGGNGWGNNELEYYTDRSNNSFAEGGMLHIRAVKESYFNRGYTSARMLTQRKFSVTYGRVEARIQIPKGQGIWPAFWMLGDDISTVSWPRCGEIDIMENIGKTANSEQLKVYGTLHMPTTSGGHSSIGGSYTASAPLADAFHIYAIEWEPTAVRFFLDDINYKTIRNTDIAANATWVFNHPFFLLLNVAVGGNWPGPPDDAVFPQEMLVDYVRVYQRPQPTVAAARGVVNSASFQPGFAPGSWVTIAGTDLAHTTREWSTADFVDGRAPTVMDGVSVTVGGKPAYIAYISPTQINAQAPDVGAGSVAVQVTHEGTPSDPVNAEARTYHPGLFLWLGKWVVAQHFPGFAPAIKPDSFAGLTTAPSKPGEILILYGTGFGPTDPAIEAGTFVTGAPATRDPVTVTIGTSNAPVISAVLTPTLLAVYQIAITVPDLPDGDYPITAQIAGQSTPDGVYLTIAR